MVILAADAHKYKNELYETLVARFKDDPQSRYHKIITDFHIKEYILKNRKRGLYNCNHCKSSYQNIYDLALHFDFYNVTRSFYCSYKGCPYTVLGFASSNECNRHLNSVHGDKSHACPDCTQAFSRIDQLNAHIARTHKNPHSRFNKKLSKQKSMSSVNGISSIVSSNSKDPGNILFCQSPVTLDRSRSVNSSQHCRPELPIKSGNNSSISSNSTNSTSSTSGSTSSFPGTNHPNSSTIPSPYHPPPLPLTLPLPYHATGQKPQSHIVAQPSFFPVSSTNSTMASLSILGPPQSQPQPQPIQQLPPLPLAGESKSHTFSLDSTQNYSQRPYGAMRYSQPFQQKRQSIHGNASPGHNSISDTSDGDHENKELKGKTRKLKINYLIN